MSSYFDTATGAVFDASRRFHAPQSADRFLDAAADIEDRVVHDVLLCTGDREFPDDLRERILNAIAVERIRPVIATSPNEGAVELPETHGRQMARATCSSELIGVLHGLFHEVASRRIVTRFGLLSDDPAGNVKRRDAHDEGRS